MSRGDITYLTDVELLTVVAQRDRGEAILKAAREAGATTGAIGYYATGAGSRERLGMLGFALDVEKDVITMLVSTEQRDTVVEHIFREAKLDLPGMGYIHITPLEKVAAYVPESVRDQLEESAV